MIFKGMLRYGHDLTCMLWRKALRHKEWIVGKEIVMHIRKLILHALGKKKKKNGLTRSTQRVHTSAKTIWSLMQ